MNNELLDWLTQWIMNYWINELELIGSSGAFPVTTYTLCIWLKPSDSSSVRRLSSFTGRWAGGGHPGLGIAWVGHGRSPRLGSPSECRMRRPFLCWPFPIPWGCGKDSKSGLGRGFWIKCSQVMHHYIYFSVHFPVFLKHVCFSPTSENFENEAKWFLFSILDQTSRVTFRFGISPGSSETFQC